VQALASPCYAPTLDARSAERINKAFDYLMRELTGDVRLSVIARQLEMSEAGFSRFFKRNTGHGFIDLMRKVPHTAGVPAVAAKRAVRGGDLL